MSDLCREVFEKHQAKLLNMDYQELKDQFDRHEQCFRKRYAAFSDFEKEFELWQAAWDVRQVEINQHQLEVHALGQANLNQAMMLAKKDEVITSLQNQLNNMESCYIGVKKERDDLNEKEILQDHFYDQAAELKNSKLMINELQKRVDETLTWLTRTDVRAINMAREILRGGDLKNLRGANDINLTR